MANSGINFALQSFCKQRKKQMVFNVPPPRYEPISPYNGAYSKFELDMRRKGEILKYNNNASSTKTNNLTKAERWAQIVNGNSVGQTSNYPSITVTTIDYLGNYNTLVVKYPSTFDKFPTTQYITDSSKNIIINKNAYKIVGSAGFYNIVITPDGAQIGCTKDDLIPTPTSASGIPGPIVYLVNDEKVPLYNYTKNYNAYSKDSISPYVDKWLFTVQNDIKLTNNTNGSFMSLLITNKIDQPFYTFSVQVPFSIYTTGTNLIIDPSNEGWFYPRLSVGINYINFGVNYNDKPIAFETQPTVTLIKSATSSQRLSYNNGSYDGVTFYPLNFDVSFDTPPTDTTDYFTAKVYAGVLSISNIVLLTKPGLVYDFFLQINTTAIQFPAAVPIAQSKYNYDIQIPTSIQGAYANASTDTIVSKNCVVYPLSSSPPPIQPLTFTGK
jgi:hypothetical protein